MKLSEDNTLYGGFWQYKSPQELNRSVNEVLIEADLKATLVKLNPEITYIIVEGDVRRIGSKYSKTIQNDCNQY